jgi:ankyrin repeat protein
LVQAAANGNIEMVEYLIGEGVNIDSESSRYRSSPLDLAVLNDHYDIAKYLLDNGAEISMPSIHDESEKSTLLYAAESGNEKMVELILGHVNNLTTEIMATAMDGSITCRNIVTLKCLLDYNQKQGNKVYRDTLPSAPTTH